MNRINNNNCMGRVISKLFVHVTMTKGCCKYLLIDPCKQNLTHHLCQPYNCLQHTHLNIVHLFITMCEVLQLIFKNLYMFPPWVVYGFNQGFKTLLYYFHQILMGNKVFFTNTSIVNMLTMSCNWSCRIFKWHWNFYFYTNSIICSRWSKSF